MHTCNAEDCTEIATVGVLCQRHDEMLKRSRAFWTPGRLTLVPMPENHPSMGQTQEPQ